MRRYLTIAALIVLLFSATGCDKWLEVNSDPVNPQATRAEYLLSPVIFQMARNGAQDNTVIFKYTQNAFAQDPTVESNIVFEKHGFTTADLSGGAMWRLMYVSHGPNVQALIEDAEANGKWTYAGIGWALKAWGYQMGTDTYGPVILDEALVQNKLTFNYQDQPEVYARVREWCQKALVCLNTPDVGNYTPFLTGASGDTMYKGDRVKWRKFIYGLLAQHYSHLVNKTDFVTKYADSVVKYVDLSFASAADDATILFTGSKNTDSNVMSLAGGSELSPNFSGTGYGRVSQTIVNALTGGIRGLPSATPQTPATATDPRTSYMIATATNGTYKGVEPTAGDVPATKTLPHIFGAVTTSGTPAKYPGKYIFAETARYPIMSYAQLQFAKAEAYLKKGRPDLAHPAYINGIKGHFDFINTYGRNVVAGTTAIQPVAITTAQMNTYLLSSEVAQSPATLQMSDIMGQKFIAQWGWAGLEQWCDLRKYRYDPLVFPFYKQLAANQLQLGAYAHRFRPRHNSEYIWNRDEEIEWGMLLPKYTTTEMWFNQP